NTGSAALVLSSLTLTGTNPGDFAQSNNCGSSVPAGGNCTISVTFTPTASGTVGSGFSYQITASNSPTSYGATGLPAGLTVNSGTGLISGAPTGAGTSMVTLSGTNSGGTGNATLTLTIAVARPVITSVTPTTGVAGLTQVTITG